MEGGYSSAVCSEAPNNDHLEGRGSEPAATEDPGTLESSSLFTKSDAPEAPEEEEGSEGPLSKQDLKDAYIQLVQGVQVWQDGCAYQGQFGQDVKLGFGEFSWRPGESYRGQFYRDHCHGFGTYTWPDGSSFTGMFYLSCREGYGTMYTKSGLFQGLYKADERFGPGIETYPDGSQDVGLWFRDHLVKLCTETPSGFSLHRYPEFQGFLTHQPARLSLSDEEIMQWDLHEDQDPFFYDYKRLLQNDDLTLPPETHIYSTDHSHMPLTCSLRRELDAWVFRQDIPPLVEDREPWFIRNETPLMVKMQKQIYKFRNKKEHSSWNVGAILEGDRSGFAHPGPKELLSRQMILKAEEGDYDWLYGVLRDGLCSPDVADVRGYTVLAAAAVHCRPHIVTLLLDSGADVDKCTDEGLTPLGMCFLLYYPSRCFKPNIAERMVPRSQETPKLSAPRNHSSVSYKSDSFDDENLVPTRGSQESIHPRGSPPGLESTSPKGSVNEPHDVLGNLDRSTLCSQETNFESDLCVYDLPLKPSQNVLEKSAWAHSMFRAPSLGESSSNKMTLRKMVLSTMEHRNRWLTINLLLHRGADPNLCRVPLHALFLAVKAGDVDGVRLLLEKGARTDIQFPLELGALTPLHIAAALPGEEGVRITELLLHAITDVDARAADQDDVYRLVKLDLLPSSLKLNNEAGPPSTYYRGHTSVPDEGGRTALHVACEREDNPRCARDVVRLLLSHRANTSLLWGGHSPLSLSIASGNDLIVKELLCQGADPNLPLTKGLGSALCVACDLIFDTRRSVDSKLAVIDRLIHYGANILSPVTLTQGDKVAVGTAVDYGYFRFYQDRRTAHTPLHTLMPAEREVFVARKKLLDYMGFQLRQAVLAKESQCDLKVLYLSKRAELTSSHRLKHKGASLPKALHLEKEKRVPFFRFCSQCGRSVGVRLAPCTRCYGILTCSKSCKTKAWNNFHKQDCASLVAAGKMLLPRSGETFQKPRKALGTCPVPASSERPQRQKLSFSNYSRARVTTGQAAGALLPAPAACPEEP